jgi:hypothetical protein
VGIRIRTKTPYRESMCTTGAAEIEELIVESGLNQGQVVPVGKWRATKERSRTFTTPS